MFWNCWDTSWTRASNFDSKSMFWNIPQLSQPSAAPNEKLIFQRVWISWVSEFWSSVGPTGKVADQGLQGTFTPLEFFVHRSLFPIRLFIIVFCLSIHCVDSWDGIGPTTVTLYQSGSIGQPASFSRKSWYDCKRCCCTGEVQSINSH